MLWISLLVERRHDDARWMVVPTTFKIDTFDGITWLKDPFTHLSQTVIRYNCVSFTLPKYVCTKMLFEFNYF